LYQGFKLGIAGIEAGLMKKVDKKVILAGSGL
jgi:hypothetical protein